VGERCDGVSGAVTVANSLVGTTSNDLIGANGVTALSNGNYVVMSSFWDSGRAVDAGAVTWGNGATGVSGAVTVLNSLVGTTANDTIGNDGVTALSNGNYVVISSFWSNGLATNAGAVTWGNGATGVSGAVTVGNSLVGTISDDNIGNDGVRALSNGNYVVISSFWDNPGAFDAGAVTWGNGASGVSGAVTVVNSLVGTTADDNVGGGGVTALSNGNYVVASPSWDNAAAFDAGAVTWGNGATGVSGAVTLVNSLVGATANDNVGGTNGHVVANSNGSYIVVSEFWDSGLVVDAGAATYGSATGVAGLVSASNSAIGSPAGSLQLVADGRTTAGAYVIATSQDRVLLLQVADLVWVDESVGAFQASTGYTDAVSATGTAPATYTVTSGALPAGVSLNESTGALTGTPTTPGAYTFTITASNAAGIPITAVFTGTVAAGPATVGPSELVPLSPGRLADTRSTGTTVDDLFAAGGARAAGSTLELTVAGRGGVVDSAQAVSLNITAVDASAAGYATVFPCGSPRPNASNLNYFGGNTLANAVITKIGTGGKVCIFVSATTQLIVDVNGLFPAGSSLVSANPARVLDTRPTGETVDNIEKAGGLRAAGSTTTITIGGRASVPITAQAVAMTVTATDTTDAGFLTVYPCGSQVPNASNLNFGPGTTIANLVISKLGTSGTVCVYSSTPTHLIVDVAGYFPAGSSYQPLEPARLIDTRVPSSTIDNRFNGVGLRPSGTTTELTVTGRGGVSANAVTVVLNITATGPTADGYVSVYPCGISQPNASNLNFASSDTVANTASASTTPARRTLSPTSMDSFPTSAGMRATVDRRADGGDPDESVPDDRGMHRRRSQRARSFLPVSRRSS
jgi:hypothetical protein